MLTTYITLLRGINVGGHHKIQMADLKSWLLELGFEDIITYIQSGNIIFQSTETDTSTLSQSIHQIIKEKKGYQIPVLTLTKQEFEQSISNFPWKDNLEKDPQFFHLTFLDSNPKNSDIEQMSAKSFLPDEFIIKDKTVYLYCPTSYGKTKLNNTFLEKQLKVSATTRNWKTVNELFNISKK